MGFFTKKSKDLNNKLAWKQKLLNFIFIYLYLYKLWVKEQTLTFMLTKVENMNNKRLKIKTLILHNT